MTTNSRFLSALATVAVSLTAFAGATAHAATFADSDSAASAESQAVVLVARRICPVASFQAAGSKELVCLSTPSAVVSDAGLPAQNLSTQYSVSLHAEGSNVVVVLSPRAYFRPEGSNAVFFLN